MGKERKYTANDIKEAGIKLDPYGLKDLGVSELIAIRVAQTGEIPTKGPGSYSIPRRIDTAIKRAREARRDPKQNPQNKLDFS